MLMQTLPFFPIFSQQRTLSKMKSPKRMQVMTVFESSKEMVMAVSSPNRALIRNGVQTICSGPKGVRLRFSGDLPSVYGWTKMKLGISILRFCALMTPPRHIYTTVCEKNEPLLNVSKSFGKKAGGLKKKKYIAAGAITRRCTTRPPFYFYIMHVLLSRLCLKGT